MPYEVRLNKQKTVVGNELNYLPEPSVSNVHLYRPKTGVLVFSLLTGVSLLLLLVTAMVNKWHAVYGLIFVTGGWIFAIVSVKIAWDEYQPYSEFKRDPLRFAQKQYKQQEELKKHKEAQESKERELAYWMTMTGHEFEGELTRMLRGQGIQATMTKGSGDGGVDIWVKTPTGSVAIQCKAHKRPLGPASVRELHGVTSTTKARAGIVVGLGGFTEGAKEFAKKCGNMYLFDVVEVTKINMGVSRMVELLKS